MGASFDRCVVSGRGRRRHGAAVGLQRRRPPRPAWPPVRSVMTRSRPPSQASGGASHRLDKMPAIRTAAGRILTQVDRHTPLKPRPHSDRSTTPAKDDEGSTWMAGLTVTPDHDERFDMTIEVTGSSGRTGVRITPLTLGTMNFGGRRRRTRASGSSTPPSTPASPPSTPPTSTPRAVARRSSARRSQAAVATTSSSRRSSTARSGSNPLHAGNSRRWIVRAVEDSLRRLGTDHLDLYQAHRPDPHTDLLETLRRWTTWSGRARSATTARRCSRPTSWSRRSGWPSEHGLVAPLTEQLPYSLLVRGVEREVLPVAQQYGLGVISYGPLAAGWLSGGYRVGRRAAGVGARRPDPRPVRRHARAQPAQARGRRRARAARRGERADARRARARFRAQPPGDHQRDHRAAHPGAPRGLPQGRDGRRWATTSWTGSTRSSTPAPSSWSATPAATPRPSQPAALRARPTPDHDRLARRHHLTYEHP